MADTALRSLRTGGQAALSLDLPDGTTAASFGTAGFACAAGFSGIRMTVPHDLQRTVFPLAMAGTDKTFRQVRLGHMILT